MTNKLTIVPVILSGGAGSRLWPVSTHQQPKQFHVLMGQRTMFSETVMRVLPADDIHFEAPMVVCGVGHLNLAQAALAESGVQGATFLLEPLARNTAPALAAAALLQAERDPETLMLILPADHVIEKPKVLRAACGDAAAAAANGRIVTFAIVPDRPETGYGYIKKGDELSPGVYELEAFKEKPDLELARNYVESGDYAWNAGIFFFKAQTLIDELEQHAPAILEAAQDAVKLARRDPNGGVHLDGTAFAAAPAKSIDFAVMEHTQHAAIVPVDMGWSDVGSFATLWELGPKDSNGNVAQGNVLVADAHNCLVRSDGPNVAVIGVSDIMVVVTDQGILVTPRDRAQDVRIASDRYQLKPNQ